MVVESDTGDFAQNPTAWMDLAITVLGIVLSPVAWFTSKCLEGKAAKREAKDAQEKFDAQLEVLKGQLKAANDSADALRAQVKTVEDSADALRGQLPRSVRRPGWPRRPPVSRSGTYTKCRTSSMPSRTRTPLMPMTFGWCFRAARNTSWGTYQGIVHRVHVHGEGDYVRGRVCRHQNHLVPSG